MIICCSEGLKFIREKIVFIFTLVVQRKVTEIKYLCIKHLWYGLHTIGFTYNYVHLQTI